MGLSCGIYLCLTHEKGSFFFQSNGPPEGNDLSHFGRRWWVLWYIKLGIPALLLWTPSTRLSFIFSLLYCVLKCSFIYFLLLRENNVLLVCCPGWDTCRLWVRPNQSRSHPQPQDCYWKLIKGGGPDFTTAWKSCFPILFQRYIINNSFW